MSVNVILDLYPGWINHPKNRFNAVTFESMVDFARSRSTKCCLNALPTR